MKNTTTLLSANKTFSFIKNECECCQIKAKFGYILYGLTAGEWRALLLIDLEEDSSVFFLGVNNPLVFKAGDIFQRFITTDAQA